jgi:rhodanese-related sulfurtransferase
MSDLRRVPPAEAKRLVDEEGYTHLDVRSEIEFAAGHPAGALNVPFAMPGPWGMVENPEFLPVISAMWPKDAKLVVGCAHGVRSLHAARMLAAAGYAHVVDQLAGFEGARDPFGGLSEPGWADAGLPVEHDAPGATWAELRAKAGLG